MLHRGISQIKAVQVVEDIVNAGRFALDVFSIRGDQSERVEGEDRWEVGADFWNEQALNLNGEPPAPKYWIESERHEKAGVDWIGIERGEAAKCALFSSTDELNLFIEKGESKMRKSQLIAAYAAVDYLIEQNRALTARFHNDKLSDSRRALHDTGLMKIAIEVQKKYWPDARATPKQEAIIPEIRAQYALSEAEAKAVERVACPIKRSK